MFCSLFEGNIFSIVIFLCVTAIRVSLHSCDVAESRPEVIFREKSNTFDESSFVMSKVEKKPSSEVIEEDEVKCESDYTPYNCGGKRKYQKDPNAPKRALSAFFWFCNSERSAVREANPDLWLGDVARELGRRWDAASPATKEKFEAEAAEDQARYEREMAEYEKIPKPTEVEDDDEEEELKRVKEICDQEEEALPCQN